MGVMMADDAHIPQEPDLLDAVALLVDTAADGLTRGQVGTIVEPLDDATVLVEFNDDDGRTYAIVPCLTQDLLVLRYVPEAA